MKNMFAIRARAITGLLALVLIAAANQPARAQTPAGMNNEEERLRELVRLENEGKTIIKHTNDSILSSGATPLPVIGTEARKKLFEELNAKRLNQTRKVEPIRMVVSNSGDMAYEFGNFTMSYDTPEKKHVAFTGSYLRVWRKVGGEWMVDALSARPHGQVGATPASKMP